MTHPARDDRPAPAAEPGDLVVIRRLHRLVRHGYRPWLGYDVSSGQDQDIQLHRRDGTATIGPDGALVLRARPPAAPVTAAPVTVAPHDAAAFDALFPANTPNRRNLMRRLYEIGILAP